MLGVGYTLSALSPLLLGVLRDRTGSFTAVLWALVAGAAALVAVDASVSPRRLATARSFPKHPPRAASS
jgi:CP family cyanate transporter-like MFS transporter